MGIRGKRFQKYQVGLITKKAIEEIDRCIDQVKWLMIEREFTEQDLYENYLTLQDQQRLNKIRVELQL